MTYLTELLSPWLEIAEEKLATIKVQTLELDSRKIVQGDTFVAIKGHLADGRQYIEKAIALGATSVLAQADEQFPHGHIVEVSGVPVVYIEDLNTQLSSIAVRFNL